MTRKSSPVVDDIPVYVEFDRALRTKDIPTITQSEAEDLAASVSEDKLITVAFHTIHLVHDRHHDPRYAVSTRNGLQLVRALVERVLEA